MKFQNDSLDDISGESGIVDQNSACDDRLSSVNTEDSLLSSKASSETISKSDTVACCAKEEIRRKWRDPKFKLILGCILLLWGVCTILWSPLELMMTERLRMRPGLPAHDWWKNPPDEVLLRAYIFNITNAEKFLNGVDAKLNLQEIGPIIFREKLLHTHVTFNDNDTMTYVATRKAIFLPEKNHIDLNQTITVPNLAVLGMASFFWDSAFYEKWAFNMLVRSSKANTTVNISIYNYLWNFTDPLMDMAKSIVPGMVPVNNLGILSNIYDKFQDNVTSYIGTANGHEKFFLIDRYDGSEYLPGHGDRCEDTIINSTEGVSYPQYLTKNTTLKYWRKTLCKVMTLHYESEQDSRYGVKSYKFTLPNNTYDRTKPDFKDCYKSEPVLQNGLSDVSKCYFDFPMAASFPHFLYGDPGLKNNVNGLEPDVKKHESYVDVEPVTGIPLESRARSQSNLILRKLEGFKDEIQMFSEIVLPMFWLEYNQVGLPWYIAGLLYFTVRVMPILQRVFTVFLLTSGMLLLVLGLRQIIRSRRNYLSKNKQIHYEQEVFLKI